MKERANDRVFYSISRKINMGNYENVEISYGYSSDLNDGETLKDARSRVVEHVEKFIGKKEQEIRENIEEN